MVLLFICYNVLIVFMDLGFKSEATNKPSFILQWMDADKCGEETEWATSVKQTLRVFKLDAEWPVYQELKALRNYIVYKMALKEWDEKVLAARANFEALRRRHVDMALEEFDRSNKKREEESKWKWSPLYQIVRKWPIPNFRAAPWDHTESEWRDMCDVLLQNTTDEPQSLEVECPHILRVLLSLVRSLQGFDRPISHPTRGLTKEYIVQLARDPHHSAAMRRISTTLSTTGWITFPGIHNAAEHMDILFGDVEALLGFDPSMQDAVVGKVESFIGRIAQRAIADMVRMERGAELGDMWFNAVLSEQRQRHCDEVGT